MAMLNLIANKTTPLLLLCALATPVFANYCDTRATQRDYDNCYRVNIDTQNKLVEKYYREVIDHPNLAAADRAITIALYKSTARIWKAINHGTIPHGT